MVWSWFSSSAAMAAVHSRHLEQLKQAETLLLRFAQQRYNDTTMIGNHESTARTNDDNTCSISIETLDTIVPFPKGIHRQGDNTNNGANPPTPPEDEKVTIHAIKITNQNTNSKSRFNIFQDKEETTDIPIVALHGYYNGAAYYYRNFAGLASLCQTTMYSIDWLGWGLSSRPHYKVNDNPTSSGTNSAGNQKENDIVVTEAEDWFVESLEAWRAHHQIPKMILVGHSFGGYMSVAYAERYPERVHHLALLSPVGVPDPETDPSYQERMNRMTSTWRSSIFLQFFRTMFDWTTPGGFVRSLGEERALGLVSRYVTGRMPSLPKDEQTALADYLFHNAHAGSSGENALKSILHSNVMAKYPLVHRIPRLFSDGPNKIQGGISIHYGQYDWMDMSGGLAAAAKADGNVQVYVVPNCGHLLLLENPLGTNASISEGIYRGSKNHDHSLPSDNNCIHMNIDPTTGGDPSLVGLPDSKLRQYVLEHHFAVGKE